MESLKTENKYLREAEQREFDLPTPNDNVKEPVMSEPLVYQIDVAKTGTWFECTKEQFEIIRSGGLELVDFRILYPTTVYEQLKSENEKLRIKAMSAISPRYKKLYEDKIDALKAENESLKAELEQKSKTPIELECVQNHNDYGFWRPCSGCHETNEGYPLSGAVFSKAFNCYLGCGCSECGGLGAVWDTTDYEKLANEYL